MILPHGDAVAFALFAVVTVARQFSHVVAWGRRRDVPRDSRPSVSRDDLRTVLFYVVYISIWVASGWHLFRWPPSALPFLVGMALIVSATCLRYCALHDLGRFFASRLVIVSGHRLVTDGVYSRLRHPLHLALLAELAGMAIVSGSLVLLMVWIGFVPVVVSRNRLEDAVLTEVFGATAAAYQASVPSMAFWLGARRAIGRISGGVATANQGLTSLS